MIGSGSDNMEEDDDDGTVLYCNVCSEAFDPSVTGVRCRTRADTCRLPWCQLCEITHRITIITGKYLCSTCGSYSCARHGHHCQDKDCGHMMCDACDYECEECGRSYCRFHIVRPALLPGEQRRTLCTGCIGRKPGFLGEEESSFNIL
jgi:hypothetical protein